MNTEERDRLVQDRLVKVETLVDRQANDINAIMSSLKRLEALANMGSGAISVFLKVGTVLSMLIAAAWALFDKWHK